MRKTDNDHGRFETAPCSVRPLLRLSLLEELDMQFGQSPLAVDQLWQLASLQHLKAVSLEDHGAATTFAAGLTQAWGALPLTRLELSGMHGSRSPYALMPAAALQAVSELVRLQTLTLSQDMRLSASCRQCMLLEASFAQLAAVLQPLTALQH